MSFDQKCYDLAEHFYPKMPEAKLNELAGEIQSLVENYGQHYDPTPWCIGCGAMMQADCTCGPIAENN